MSTEQEVDDALMEALAKGWVEIVDAQPDGQTLWRLTEAGMAHVEQMILAAPDTTEDAPNG